ncbi:Hypothetical predicted protein [Mytilus galloprovincialis]|uniref:SMB domain-containing protein n=1 Tax=Mytilus galloprovincialis TaxID=29158 RepID=A0A8B6H168_MYTGA|nr:Hypothetical predicted protein [Mytilus galloprovincialis]
MDFKTSKVLYVMVGCLVILITSRTSYAFNLTHILDEYISVCGSQICNIKKQGTNYLNHLQTTYNTHCPKCSCQVGCIQSGNCCPDLFFSLKPTCVKTSIVESPDWYFTPLYEYGTYSFDINNHMDTKLNAVNCPPVLMISSCPQDATVIEKSLCNVSDLKEQQIQNKPVSSSKTGLIYRNIHCLKCHNESVENLILWNLKLECDYDRFEDFNYLVSYNEIIQKAIDEKCSIAFEPNDKVSKRICVPDSNTIDLDRISSCNVSGTWQIYDHDLDVACQSYDHTYFSFKNVFCYLCNPPSDTGHLISTCNATGMWEQYDANLQIACEKEKSSSITGKFKNIFCYLCNKNFSDEGNLPFYGADVNVEDNGNLASNEPFGYNFKVKSVNIRNIFNKDDLKRSTVTSDKRLISLSNSDLESEHYLSSFKMANLMKKYFALTGKTNFCTNYSLFNSLQDCNCDDYCAVQFYNERGNGSYCVDSFIRKKSICTDQKYHEYNRFLVYEGCERFGNSTIKNLCQKTKQKTVHDDLISFLPAQMLINNTPIDFKNIYCAFCNENLEVIQNYENEMVLWDFKLRCKVFIPIFYHFSLQDIIAFALNNGCRFLYKPPSSATVCSYHSFTMCNMTGNWNSFDPDIASACNNYKVPYGTENKFCSMCNPSVRENIVYTSCNNTGEWGEYNSNIEENCLNMPAVEYHSPYKNIFCKECNRKNVEIYDLPNNNSTSCLGDCEFDINELETFIPRFRSIFKFTDYKIATTESDIEGNCLQNQIYNPFEKICIDLKCYPGRILTGEGCKPLLEMTRDIGYMLTFVLNGNRNTEIGDVISFLDDVYNSLRIAMFNKDWYRRTLKKSILICQNRIFWNSTNISLLVIMNISYPHYVNRTSVEDSFLSSSKFSLPVHYFNTTFNLSVFPNEDMYLLSTLESQSKFINTCITTDDNHKHLKRYSHVKRLLLCKQIELPENDIDIDNKTFRLTIKSLGVELTVMDYEMLPTSKVRICADQFESIISLKHTELDKPITYQNFIGFILMACTCISLKIYIDLKCYPGRILTEERCKPLLEMTKDIGYMLTFALNGNLSTEISDVISFLHDVDTGLHSVMLNKNWYRWTIRESQFDMSK